MFIKSQNFSLKRACMCTALCVGIFSSSPFSCSASNTEKALGAGFALSSIGLVAVLIHDIFSNEKSRQENEKLRQEIEILKQQQAENPLIQSQQNKNYSSNGDGSHHEVQTAQDLTETILQQKQEISNLKKLCEKLNKKIESYRAEKEQREKELSEICSMLSAEKRQVIGLNETVETLRKGNELLKSNCEPKFRELLSIKEAEINKLHSELFKSQEQTRKAFENLQSLQQQWEQELEKVAPLLTNIEKMEKDNGALHEKFSQLQKQKEELTQQFENQKRTLLKEIEKLKKENEALKEAKGNEETSCKA